MSRQKIPFPCWACGEPTDGENRFRVEVRKELAREGFAEQTRLVEIRYFHPDPPCWTD